jgi:CBS domain-containing protein
MANRRFQDTSRENGMIGGVQGYGAEGREGTQQGEEGARYYRAAMHRPSEERDDERMRGSGATYERGWRGSEDRERGGRGFSESGRGSEQSFERGGDWGNRGENWRGERFGRGDDWRGGEQRYGRGDDWRGGEHRYGRGEDWRGGEHRYGRGDDWRGERWGRDENWRGGGTESGRGGERFERGRAGFDDFGTPSYGQGRELREQYSDRDFAGRDERYAGRSGMAYGGEPGREQRRGRRLWEREPAVARDIMTANPKAVRREASLRDVAQIMRDENCGVVPVVDDSQRLIGLITDRDMVMRTTDHNRPWTESKAGEVMTDEVEAVTPETSVRDIIQLMGKKQIRRVPVVDRNDRMLGMISMADVATRANEDEELQEALDRISKRRSFWSRLWT